MASGSADDVIFELTGDLEEIVKKISINVTAELVEITPRDTGWAAANWIPNITTPALETAGTAEQAKDGNVSFAPQQIGIADVLTSYRLSRGPIFVTNNVPYIRKLNDGSSMKAPAGFVQQAIIKGLQKTEASTK